MYTLHGRRIVQGEGGKATAATHILHGRSRRIVQQEGRELYSKPHKTKTAQIRYNHPKIEVRYWSRVTVPMIMVDGHDG
jgi:hypothetical protein